MKESNSLTILLEDGDYGTINLFYIMVQSLEQRFSTGQEEVLMCQVHTQLYRHPYEDAAKCERTKIHSNITGIDKISVCHSNYYLIHTVFGSLIEKHIFNHVV